MTSIRLGIFAWVAMLLCIDANAEPPAKAHVALNIASQPLADAFTTLAQQTGIQILVNTEDVAQAHAAPRIVGTLTPEAALQQLVANTDLKYEFINDRTVRVSRVAEPSKEAQRKTSATSGGMRNYPLMLADASSKADADNDSKEAEAGSSDRPATLSEVTVTAQKRRERLQDVPISISVLNGDDLDKSRAEGITEALRSVPGVSAMQQAGGTLVTVRGVTASGPVFGGTGPIAYYVDSVPFGLVQTAITPDSNAYDLERVEVLRGPQGTLYGASAQNGVVRILTHDADLNAVEFKARTSASSTERGGSNYRGDMALNVPLIEDKLAVRAVVGYQNSDGWIDKPNDRNANDVEIRNWRLKVNAKPTDALSIDLSSWISRADYGAASVSDSSEHYPAPLPEPISTDYNAYGLKLGYTAAGVSLASMTSYLQFQNTSAFDLDFPFGDPNIFLTDIRARVFSQEMVLNSNHGGPWQWTFGGIYRDATDKSAQTYGPFPSGASSFDSESYAVFGEVSRRFADGKWQWTLGGRYFHDNVVFDELPFAPPIKPPFYFRDEGTFSATTPRVVLTWYPKESLTFYGSYSEGFRSGAPETAGPAGGVPGAFPSVKPDTLHNYELGAKVNWPEHGLSVETAVYYIKWNDVQQQIIVPFLDFDFGTTAVINAPSASGMGFDLGITARPVEGLTLGLNANWNGLEADADVISTNTNTVLYAKGDRLSFSPEYTLGASAEYAFPIGSFRGRFSVSANYTADQSFRTVLLGTQSIGGGDPIMIAATSFSLQAAEHWGGTLFVDNLLDERGGVYFDPFTEPALRSITGLRVRPRTIGLQLEYKF